MDGDNSKQPQICVECGKQYSTRSKLARHRKESHGQNRFQCEICERKFGRRENLQKHMLNTNVHLTCASCGLTGFSNRKQLSDHKRTDHSISERLRGENNSFRVNGGNSSKNQLSPTELAKLPAEDPAFPDLEMLNSYPLEYRNLVASNWVWIRTKYTRRSVTSSFSLRFAEGDLSLSEAVEFLHNIHQIQKTSYKIQLQFGYVYRCVINYDDPTEEERLTDPAYFIPQKPSANNVSFLPEPWTVASQDHLEDLISRLKEADILEHLNLRRPSTKYIVDLVPNLMVYVYQMDKAVIGCCQDQIPRYLLDRKSVMTLYYRNSARKEPWKEPRCFFRCLAARNLTERKLDQNSPGWNHLLEQWTDHYFHRYCNQLSIDPSDFDGSISLNDLIHAERCFQVRVFVYELLPKDSSLMESPEDHWRTEKLSATDLTAHLLRKPEPHASGPALFLDLCGGHFSLILNIQQYSSTFLCGNDGCKRMFSSRKLCHQHGQRCNPSAARKVRCTGGGYEPGMTLFDQLEAAGVSTPANARFMEYFATYDCETVTIPIPKDQQLHGASTRHEADLLLASISICSSVPGYREPKFFLSSGDPQDLVEQCLDYLLEISGETRRLLSREFDQPLQRLEEKILLETDAKVEKHLQSVKEKLDRWISQLHVFGWNSRGFDLPLLRSYLFSSFKRRGVKVQNILKKSTSYLLLAVEDLKFLDMQSLISPHASYSEWLKSLEIPDAEKSFFPFGWFDSLEKLEQRQLPPRELWTNDLKAQPLTDAEWGEIENAWKSESMKTMKDFLKYYNNKDVSHFVDGVIKQKKFWEEYGICMITDAVSLSGLAFRLFNHFLPPDTYFALPRKEDYNFIRLLRLSVCGGLAQVFRRLHVSGVTRIRNGPQIFRSLEGWDANSLYLTELGQEMPVGVPYEWRPCGIDAGYFKRKCLLPDSVSLRELEWVSFESWKRQRRIIHYLSSKNQFRIPDSQYRADGMLPPNLIFEFQGCHVHGHQFEDPSCSIPPLNSDEYWIAEQWKRTREKIDHLKARGFIVLEMPACEWERRRKNDPEVRSYLTERFYPKNHRKTGNRMSSHDMLCAILRGDIFGLALVDIETPLALRNKFNILQPLILNRVVERSDLGPLMERYCLEKNLLNKPRRVLGQAFAARNLLLITPLLRWYLSHGLVVKKIHWIRQFTPLRPFQSIVEKVTECRKAADRDVSLKLQGNSMKLAGNSIYGKTLECGANYTNTKVADETGLKRMIARPSFRSAEPVCDDIFEVEIARSQYAEDKPLIVGFFILQYSKLRMLRFVYDFLNKYLKSDSWEPVLMDTDSMYIAMASENMEDIVLPGKREEFLEMRTQFLALTPDQIRTPGLMKLEYKGTGCVALAPKSYYCFNHLTGKDKCSSKGVQKSNRLTAAQYYRVLSSQRPHSVTNKGLWFRSGKFVKYSQTKSGLPFLITKMRTESDGITLTPLPEPENGLDAILDYSEFEVEPRNEDFMDISEEED